MMDMMRALEIRLSSHLVAHLRIVHNAITASEKHGGARPWLRQKRVRLIARPYVINDLLRAIQVAHEGPTPRPDGPECWAAKRSARHEQRSSRPPMDAMPRLVVLHPLIALIRRGTLFLDWR